MIKVLLIGSTGFVGKHIAEALASSSQLFTTTRKLNQVNRQTIYFDYEDKNTWQTIISLQPDLVINAAGYGVVKEQTNLETMYAINYRLPVQLIRFFKDQGLSAFWLQLGTAFEYDLTISELTEESPCAPMTHYGISKFMCSHFLLTSETSHRFLILRPFAMFGPYESDTKLVPYLIQAQKNQKTIHLSTGEQKRDYFYVKDLAAFIRTLIVNGLYNLEDKVINIGSEKAKSLKNLAAEISPFVPGLDTNLWQWGMVAERNNEHSIFFNASSKARDLGFILTASNIAYQETIDYYFNMQ